ncbi:MAG: ABC transporter permease [Chloroflexota bacterium]
MGVFILRRIAISIPLLLAITMVTFAFINLAPGDPVDAMINPQDQLKAQDLERMREALGLNKPIPVRYVIWLGQAAQGNFGYSYSTEQPVLRVIAARMPPTLELMGAALIISTVLGVVFGVLSALHVYSLWDYVLGVLSLVGLSVPSFFFALVILDIFAAKLQILPPYGMGSEVGPPSLTDNLTHLILPATALSLELIASFTRYARSAVLEVMRSDFVTTARAKGLGERTVVWRHIVRNATIPLITIASLRLPLLIGGAIIIETMFQWPGMGLLSIEAIRSRDYPVLMGLTFLIAALVLASNLLADVLYACVDPRIRV